ncbi:hypothetical protein D083_4271 [Dickeya solani RNS 08.23.3.1.A]|nr:hypothetical protein D083_4271 [Dickeya solani RNS 08.23.3.1.A]
MVKNQPHVPPVRSSANAIIHRHGYRKKDFAAASAPPLLLTL